MFTVQLLRVRTFLVMGILLLAGCSQSARDLSLDQEQAREALQTFLKTWQEGGTSKSLEPGLIGVDEDWNAGKKLVSFEVLPDETNDGTNLHIPVKLMLSDASGEESQSEPTYCVGTSPRVTVFRD